MFLQEITILYIIKKIIIYIITLFIIYSLIIKLYYKNNSCKLSYIWDKFQYKNIIKGIKTIKQIIKHK